MKLVVRPVRKPRQYWLVVGNIRHELRLHEIAYILGGADAFEQGARLREIARDLVFMHRIGFASQEVPV